MKKELYIGIMSGTSMDGIDCALVDLSNAKLNVLACHSEPIPDQLKKELLALKTPGDNELNRMGRADTGLGHTFAKGALSLLAKTEFSASDIFAVGSHGQTIRHHPNNDYPFTLQIGDANVIAAKTGITTVADFRRKDIANGGQGAPLAPAFHQAVLQSETEDRVILNIGGMSNITILPMDNQNVIGFDTGPGNTLLDAWARQHLNQDFDAAGQWARAGQVNQDLLEKLLTDPYFKLPPPKSTGFEHFNLDRLQSHANAISPQDMQATLTELSAQSIANDIKAHAPEKSGIYVCGGGLHNLFLMERLQKLLPDNKIESLAKLDIDPDFLEAICFAWLAKQTLNHQSLALQAITGASTPSILGSVFLAL